MKVQDQALPDLPRVNWDDDLAFLAPPANYTDRERLLKGEFCFVGLRRQLGWVPDWEAAGANRLWQYCLHYFDWIWLLPYADAREVVRDWIARHTVSYGHVGWEPYPVSLRLINWLGFFFQQHRATLLADERFATELWKSIYHSKAQSHHPDVSNASNIGKPGSNVDQSSPASPFHQTPTKS